MTLALLIISGITIVGSGIIVTIFLMGGPYNGTSGALGAFLATVMSTGVILTLCAATYLASFLIGGWAWLLWPAAAYGLWKFYRRGNE